VDCPQHRRDAPVAIILHRTTGAARGTDPRLFTMPPELFADYDRGFAFTLEYPTSRGQGLVLRLWSVVRTTARGKENPERERTRACCLLDVHCRGEAGRSVR